MNNNRSLKISSSRQGMIMIIVMIVIVLISLAGYSFLNALLTENKAVHLRGDALQAENLVASGVSVVQALSLQSAEQRAELFSEGTESTTDLFRGVLVSGEEDSLFRGRFSILSADPNAETRAKVRFGPENESNKLNLHAVRQWEAETPGQGKEALLQLPYMTEPIADALLDWLDDDSQTRSQGAETEYYNGLNPAYAARNDVPLSLDEFLLVRDVTKQMLYGYDLNHDFYVAPNEQALLTEESSTESLDESSSSPWSSLLTLHSAERNESFTGEPLLNINDENLEELHQELTSKLGSAWAKYIITYRQYGAGSPKPDAAIYKSAQSADTIPLSFSVPGKFPIPTLLDLVGTTVKFTPSGSDKEIHYASPAANDPENFKEELGKLFDQLTVDAENVIVGRINVNQASTLVLQCVPGIEEELANQITGSREDQSSIESTSERRYPIWLLTEELVTLDKMREILPYLTCRGDVFNAQIVGFFDQSGPSSRVEAIIDGTQRSPRVVHWKDLKLHGLPYPLKFLGAEIDTLDLEPATN